MTEQHYEDDEVMILVDFGGGQLRQVADDYISHEEVVELGEKSREAVDKAFGAIRWVAKKAKATLENLHERPDEMELEFGIAITTKAGVIVVQGEAEFHIKAKLVWKKPPSLPAR